MATNKPIRVVVVDDQTSVREGLALILDTFDGVELVAEVADGQSALEQCARLHPDVVLMDLMMPQMDGLTATQLICERFPDIRVIILTGNKDQSLRQAAIRAGATCCLAKDVTANTLVGTIRQSVQILSSDDGVVSTSITEVESEIAGQKYVPKTLHETSRNHTEELRNAKERIEAILNSVGEAIIVLQTDGRIERINPAFEEHTGYSRNEISQITWIELLADKAVAGKVFREISSVVGAGHTWRGELLMRRKDGENYDAAVTVAPVVNPTSERPAYVCSIQDISSLKEAEHMKDYLVSTVNHELRTPIAGFIFSADYLTKYYEQLTDEVRLAKIRQIQAQARVLSELVDAILDISQIEGQGEKPGTDSVAMWVVVEEVVDDLRPSAQAKRQTFDLSVDPFSLMIRGDALDFSRVWRNLISNAIKYTPNAGKIWVRLGTLENTVQGVQLRSSVFNSVRLDPPGDLKVGPYIVGQVEDTGHGIGPDDLERLFSRFYRGWAKTSGIPGTGLGLALVREIITMYGGSIQVQSQLESGSLFTFWIPVDEGQRW